MHHSYIFLKYEGARIQKKSVEDKNRLNSNFDSFQAIE